MNCCEQKIMTSAFHMNPLTKDVEKWILRFLRVVLWESTASFEAPQFLFLYFIWLTDCNKLYLFHCLSKVHPPSILLGTPVHLHFHAVVLSVSHVAADTGQEFQVRFTLIIKMKKRFYLWDFNHGMDIGTRKDSCSWPKAEESNVIFYCYGRYTPGVYPEMLFCSPW